MQKDHQLIQALLRQPTDRTPVWIMRQAGRYLPEYRALREKAGSFLALCQNPELACEITLQPLRRFDLDAAIIFSDILVIPDAMGMPLSFVEGEGPKFQYALQTLEQIEALKLINPIEDLRYVGEAIHLTQRELNHRVPLIGFSGSPWTLATYMVEGGSSRDFHQIKKMLYQAPAQLHFLLEKLAHAVQDYLNFQIASGVDVVMLFDTWGGILPHQAYLDFSLHYMKRVLEGLHRIHQGRRIPVIFFTKQGGLWLEEISHSGCDAIGLDWTMNIKQARERVGSRVALQGNLDPFVLYASPEKIRQEVKTILDDYGQFPGHIFNLGHGILPDTPIESVQCLIEAIHSFSLM